ncbi:MAG: hypothetical protein ACREVO_03610 [Steroidobacteraceae bacterium]
MPADAVNELQMWQAATFDPQRIDVELGWAQGLGINTMRVFLHNLLWQQDPSGFKQRIRTFLRIAARRSPAYTTRVGCRRRARQCWTTRSSTAVSKRM